MSAHYSVQHNGAQSENDCDDCKNILLVITIYWGHICHCQKAEVEIKIQNLSCSIIIITRTIFDFYRKEYLMISLGILLALLHIVLLTDITFTECCTSKIHSYSVEHVKIMVII